MSLCTGGGRKKEHSLKNQVAILTTLKPAGKRKILLYECIFFDIKINSFIFPKLFEYRRPGPIRRPATN